MQWVAVKLSKLDDVARASAKSSFYLFLGQTSSTVIMAVASILVARLLGPDNYGLYNVVLIVPLFLIPFSDLGVSPALTRFTAKLRSEGKERKASSLIKTGITFKLLLSLILSTVLFLLSDGIANVLKRPDATLLIRLCSLYLLGQAVLDTLYSIYIGLDKAEKCGFLMNIQAITKAVSSLLLILLGLGVIGATLGAGLGLLAASGIGMSLLLLRTTPALHQNSHSHNINFSQGLRVMVSYGKPLYVSALLLSCLSQYRNFILAISTSNVEIGNYSTAQNFSSLIVLLTAPIAASLFLAFSKLTLEEERESVEKMFRLSIKYTSLLVIPASLALTSLSQQFVYTLYGNQFGLAPDYLAFSALLFLSAGMGTLVLENFFNGQGDTKATLRIRLVNIIPSLPLVPILTILYGVPGLIASILVTSVLSAIYGLHVAHQRYGVSVDWISSLRIGVASIFSAILVYTFLRLSPLSTPIYQLAAGGSLYLFAFLVLAPLLGAMKKEDIENLDGLTKELPIYPIAKWILNLENRILTWRTSYFQPL